MCGNWTLMRRQALYAILPAALVLVTGFLCLNFSTQSVPRREHITETSMLSIVILGAVLTFLVTLFILRRITKPWTELKNTIVEFSGGKAPPTRDELVAGLDLDSKTEVGELSRAILAINDQLREVIGQVETQSGMKTRFLAKMSHEIRTPINGVIGMVKLLCETSLDDEQNEFALIAQSSANALLALVNNILDLSKIEAGKLQLESVPFNLRDITDEVGEILANRAHGKELELAIHYPGELPSSFLGDPNRIRQILLNLLSNAVKFTEQGEVVLRVQIQSSNAESTSLLIDVQDSGIGMTTDQLGNLFHSFVQGDASTARNFGGTGLGLVISKNLAEAMGGSLTVESVVGVGTTFKTVLTLPNHETVEREATSKRHFSDCKILIVDDRKTNRSILKQYFSSWGCPTDIADSGQEAITKINDAELSQVPYGLVVLETKLKDRTAIEVARETIEEHPESPTQFILISSVPENLIKSSEGEDFFVARLTKPIKRSTLFNMMSRLTGPSKVKASEKQGSKNTSSTVMPQKERILVVEDNEVNLKLMKELLKRRGFENVETAKDGEKAVGRFSECEFKLILMDCQMPVMDGYQASQAIRRTELAQSRQRTPIVAMTANALKGDKAVCLNAGMDDYITKPISEAELDRVFKTFLNRKLSPDLSDEKVPAPESNGEKAAGLKRSALIVEDNITNRMILCSFLSLNEIDYDEAENGAVAVEKCKSRGYDIILMDCQMPVLDGYAASELIRKTCPLNQSTPILAVTANVARGNQDKCLEAGMNGFLSKPYSEESLMESIRGLLGLEPTLEAQELDSKFFDPTVLTKLLPLDSATQREIVTSFIVELKQLFETLTPWPENLSNETPRSCLGLKGLAANLGMSALRDDLDALRKCLQENDNIHAKVALKQCQDDWSKTAPSCDKFLRELR